MREVLAQEDLGCQHVPPTCIKLCLRMTEGAAFKTAAALCDERAHLLCSCAALLRGDRHVRASAGRGGALQPAYCLPPSLGHSTGISSFGPVTHLLPWRARRTSCPRCTGTPSSGSTLTRPSAASRSARCPSSPTFAGMHLTAQVGHAREPAPSPLPYQTCRP